MKPKTFEDYMQEIHPMTLDDDLPDAYSDWLGTLDGEDYIRFGEKIVLEAYLAGLNRRGEITLESLKN